MYVNKQCKAHPVSHGERHWWAVTTTMTGSEVQKWEELWRYPLALILRLH